MMFRSTIILTLIALTWGCTLCFVNCSTLVSHEDYNHRESRAINIQAPEEKEALQAAAAAFSVMGDLRIDNFAVNYLKVAPNTIVNALKGFSVAAALLAAFVKTDDNSKEIMETMERGFNTVLKKLESQTDEYKEFSYYIKIKELIERPIKSTSFLMDQYNANPSDDNKVKFLEQFHHDNMIAVIDHITINTLDILRSTIRGSRYEWKRFMGMSTLVIRHFHQAFSIEFFSIGLQYERGGKEFLNQQANAEKLFEQRMKEVAEAVQTATEEFDKTFFPGFVEDDVVRPTIDNGGGDNCNIAQSITNQLIAKYPERFYVTVVGNTLFSNHYINGGVVGQNVGVENYNNKIVSVFMASKRFFENSQMYKALVYRVQIYDQIRKTFTDWRDMSSLVAFVNSTGQGYQMAVFHKNHHACISNREWIADNFEEVFEDWMGSIVERFPLEFTVVF